MILFDLDGTLIDTAPDLAYALNLQRARHGLPDLNDSLIRPYASHGARGLLKIGFNLTPEDKDFLPMREEYLALYQEVFDRSPQLFAGMRDVIDQLNRQKILWGVVTNKHRRFSEPLIRALHLNDQMACLVCGDDVERPKPAPDSLLKACQQTKQKPNSTLYVGDAQRDIEAGRAANMTTVVALYGYLDEHDSPEAWGADFSIHSPLELLDLNF
jgi:N-acetyl-D-muramate 6-phosphate phosphatase